jgi:hypothetical protein
MPSPKCTATGLLRGNAKAGKGRKQSHYMQKEDAGVLSKTDFNKDLFYPQSAGSGLNP